MPMIEESDRRRIDIPQHVFGVLQEYIGHVTQDDFMRYLDHAITLNREGLPFCDYYCNGMRVADVYGYLYTNYILVQGLLRVKDSIS